MVKNLTEGTSCAWHWLDILDPKPEDFEQLSSRFNLHAAIVADAQQPNHLPKFEQIDETQFAIIRTFDKEVGPSGDTVQDLTNKLAIFHGGNYLITVHKYEYPFLQQINLKKSGTDECRSPFELFIKILKESIMSFEEPALKLASDLDRFESKVFLEKVYPKQLTNDIYWLKRKAEVSKRVLNLSKTVLNNITFNGQITPEVQDLRDTYLRILTMYDEIDNSTNNLINIYIGLASQRTNETMRVLTIFSAFFLPLTFIAGVYGMNFKYMPELEARYGYPTTWLVMFLITIGVYTWFKKRGWL